MKKSLMSLVCCFPLTGHASFYDRKAEGWHWYEFRNQGSEIRDQGLRSNDKPKKEGKPELKPPTQSDPVVRLEAFKRRLSISKLSQSSILQLKMSKPIW